MVKDSSFNWEAGGKMANVRLCDTGRHHYVAMGSRLRCAHCGAVQIDLTEAQYEEELASKVFRARKPTLFSVRIEGGEELAARTPFHPRRRGR